MNTVMEIERAIQALSPEQLEEFAAWFAEKRELAIEAAFEKAILGGQFDAMADRAFRDAEAGKCWPLDEFVNRA